MIKPWEIGDQIQDHNRGEIRCHPEGSWTLVSVNGPWGIAIEGNMLYVASNQDSAIYEFDLTKTPPQLSGAPNNITVETANEQ